MDETDTLIVTAGNLALMREPRNLIGIQLAMAMQRAWSRGIPLVTEDGAPWDDLESLWLFARRADG